METPTSSAPLIAIEGITTINDEFTLYKLTNH
jgi:hypothetical protein